MALVCLCHGVSERTVVKAIDRGARTVDDVGRACRAGTGCGVCRDTVAELIAARTGSPVRVRSAAGVLGPTAAVA